MRCQFNLTVASRYKLACFLLSGAILASAGAQTSAPASPPPAAPPAPKRPAAAEKPGDVLRDAAAKVPPFAFSKADEALLDEIQFACFQYFWKEVGAPAALAKDRLKAPVASIAAVGFQLSALPIGVERKWITRDEGRTRALTVLTAIYERDDNKKFGMYLHFPDMNTGGMSHEGFESEASTVDTALLLAGAITAGEFFGGDVKALAAKFVAEAQWKRYAVAPGGLISMGWKPKKKGTLAGEGKFIEWHWHVASDEERLVYLLAVGAPTPEHAVPPEVYYKLQRTIKHHADLPPFVVSWPGNMFTYQFAHCWINHAAHGVDDPSAFGVNAPGVDWWENSRRAALTHRQRCIELGKKYKTLSAERWGMSACAARDGYIVPSVRPNLADADEIHEGTVAPYAAGTSIMFTPTESLAALRAIRELKDKDGKPFVWRDPKDGGYGFADCFNLDQNFASDDYVGIDQGPLLLAIENARTGLIWRLFEQNESVRRAMELLKWKQAR